MAGNENNSRSARCYRFGIFEADAATGELRRKGIRIKLNAQPFQVLLLLVERAGQLLTREEISRDLWPDGTFVDYEHSVNAAINRIRDALGDTASNPRFIETLPRRGYRFIAPVEQIGSKDDQGTSPLKTESTLHDRSAPVELSNPDELAENTRSRPNSSILNRLLASPNELPHAPVKTVRMLFILLQLMYLGFYIGALANLAEIEDLFAPLPRPTLALNVLITTAAILIPARVFVISAMLFRAPGASSKFLKMWPFLLVFDILWSLSPFLLLRHINFGLALACTTLLVYSPFAQRSLVLMGAAGSDNDAAVVSS